MKTAIITGASAGLGLEFVAQLEEFFPEIECVWLISRSVDKLASAAKLLKKAEAKIVPLDLCSEADTDKFEALLKEEKPEISLLVNNAGCGYLANIGDTDYKVQTRMVDLNIRALTAITAISVPYIINGGRIINMSSIASFCPNPRMTVYSASKSYVSAFSRGLEEELKPRKISVTAVCSGPLDTEFLDIAGIRGQSKTFDVLPFCNPKNVVSGAYKAARKGHSVHTPRAFFKFYRFVAKIVPQSLMVKFTKT
ncbi:MAG: SDR family NAD(P)-dependent oxidoreductase [Oscillospiraceae bacterium]|nr:SDR family NAD(P)-dependent oxidoreductase [Oscillospiraceae bacterium]